MNAKRISSREYGNFDKAYDYFNAELFGGELPACMITLQRKNNTLGYFWAEQFTARKGKNVVDEIALNPSHFETRTDKDILSTLVHEMAHLWQQHFGKPSRGGYHNRQWGAKMRELGLIPSDTGRPGGKETGQCMSHYVEKEGAFSVACDKLTRKGFRLTWQAREQDRAAAAAKRASKTKYTCPGCDMNAWAKPGVSLCCGECECELVEND